MRYRKIVIGEKEYGWLASGEVTLRVGTTEKGKPRYGQVYKFDPDVVFGREKPRASEVAEWIYKHFASASRERSMMRGDPIIPGTFTVRARFAAVDVVPGTGTLPDEWWDQDDFPRSLRVSLSYQDGMQAEMDLERFVLLMRCGNVKPTWKPWPKKEEKHAHEARTQAVEKERAQAPRQTP